MYGNHFYNETTRRYVAVFGTHFNDIVIDRTNKAGEVEQRLKVPIHYAPMQKILARLEEDPNLDAPAMTLPRMSFEITGMNYAPERKLTSLTKFVKPSTDNNTLMTRYAPAPYDIDFQLNVMAKYNEDGTKILEQILPYFKPSVAPSVKILDDLELYIDVPIILNSVTVEDIYEGAFEERRSLIWTLSFTLKGYYFGPTVNKKVIKFTESNLYTEIDKESPDTVVDVRPGLTATGEPTSSIFETVDYQNINIDDNWAYIVQIEDIE